MELSLFIKEIETYLYDNVKYYDYESIEDYFDDIYDLSVEIDIVANLKEEVYIVFKFDNNLYIVSDINQFIKFHKTLLNIVRKSKLKRII